LGPAQDDKITCNPMRTAWQRWKNIPLELSLARCAFCWSADLSYESVEYVAVQVCNRCEYAVENSDFSPMESLMAVWIEKDGSIEPS